MRARAQARAHARPQASSLTDRRPSPHRRFPHFYALAWTLRKDYARGGHVMVPVVDATGGAWTAQQALRHSYLLALVPPVAALLGVVSPMFAVEGIALNG